MRSGARVHVLLSRRPLRPPNEKVAIVYVRSSNLHIDQYCASMGQKATTFVIDIAIVGCDR
jgi:hypothetical protein